MQRLGDEASVEALRQQLDALQAAIRLAEQTVKEIANRQAEAETGHSDGPDAPTKGPAPPFDAPIADPSPPRSKPAGLRSVLLKTPLSLIYFATIAFCFVLNRIGFVAASLVLMILPLFPYYALLWLACRGRWRFYVILPATLIFLYPMMLAPLDPMLGLDLLPAAVAMAVLSFFVLLAGLLVARPRQA
jgi:hypothetical protein